MNEELKLFKSRMNSLSWEKYFQTSLLKNNHSYYYFNRTGEDGHYRLLKGQICGAQSLDLIRNLGSTNHNNSQDKAL